VELLFQVALGLVFCDDGAWLATAVPEGEEEGDDDDDDSGDGPACNGSCRGGVLGHEDGWESGVVGGWSVYANLG